MSVTTNKEHRKVIRKQLKKKLGYTNRDISVRSNGGNSTNVLLKNAKCLNDKEKIEKIAKGHSEIDYDKRTREILSGGNHFVFVDADKSVYKDYLDEADEIVDSILKNEGIEKEIGNLAIVHPVNHPDQNIIFVEYLNSDKFRDTFNKYGAKELIAKELAKINVS